MSSDPEPSPAETLIEHARRLDAELDVEEADRLLTYLDAMLQTNEHVNLTAVRDWDQAVVLHALDSLAFARAGVTPHHAIDIGTGNGFPGVAVAALHPRATVLLIDRTGKKVRAIGMCLVTAGLDRVETRQLDAAQAPALHKDMRHAFDLATARAVGQPAAMAELAEPLIRPGGHLVLWLDADAEAPKRLGRFHLVRVAEYDLPEPAARHRKLAVYQHKR